MITEAGYIIPTWNEIYLDGLNAFKTTVPGIRVTDSNPLIVALKYDATKQYDGYLQVAKAYSDLSVFTATGRALGIITDKIGMSWLPATRATSTIKITGPAGTIIPITWQLKTLDDKKFITTNTQPVIIPETGILYSEVVATVAGSDSNTEIGTITEQVVFIPNVKVANEVVAVGGRNSESDTELRFRYLRAIEKKSSFSTEGIKRYILENTTVTKCQVIENDKDVQDSQGRPPHSFEVIVIGDTNDNIFQAIYDYKLAGIKTHGDLSKKYGDIDIRFTRATVTDVSVKITISVINEVWQDTFKNAITSGLIDAVDEVEPNGIIHIWKLIGVTYKNSIGIKDLDIKIKRNGGSYAGSDISLNPKEVARLLAQNVEYAVKVV